MDQSTMARAGSSPAVGRHECHLCGGDQLELRFPERRADTGEGAGAYACTSLGHRSHPPIYRCKGCGLLFQSPMPTGEALIDAYRAVEDPTYETEKESRYLTFRRVLRQLGPGNGQRLLDVGAYCGYFLDVAREGGYQAEGLELSRWAAGRGRSLGFEIHEQSLAERAAAGDRYDVVTMWDVIEHVSEPRAEIEAAYALVKPGGRLYVSTIDASSPAARLMGARWPWLMDMHLYYFNRATIRTLLTRAGFEVRSIGLYTHVVSTAYLLQKAAAAFPKTKAGIGLLDRVLPDHWQVPVNLGDNMLVTAVRRT